MIVVTVIIIIDSITIIITGTLTFITEDCYSTNIATRFMLIAASNTLGIVDSTTCLRVFATNFTSLFALKVILHFTELVIVGVLAIITINEVIFTIIIITKVIMITKATIDVVITELIVAFIITFELIELNVELKHSLTQFTDLGEQLIISANFIAFATTVINAT